MNVSGQAVVTAAQTDLVPLSLLRAGEHGRVGRLHGSGETVHRLREMGLHDGAPVQMVRPGSPCIIRLRGRRLGFRMDDVAHVLVQISAAS
ncbi:MAG: ferrous iron transport protein A [Isosphaeraceae bacterium]